MITAQSLIIGGAKNTSGGGGGGTPEGPNRAVQFNDSGVFGGISGVEIISSGALQLTASAIGDPALIVTGFSSSQTSYVGDFSDGGSTYTPTASFTFRGVGLGSLDGSMVLVDIDQETDDPWALVFTNKSNSNVYAGIDMTGSSSTFSITANNISAVATAGLFLCCDGAAGNSSLTAQSGANIVLGGSGSGIQTASGSTLGFYGATTIAKPTVTGSKSANAALTSLMTALANLGLVVNSNT